MVVVSEHQGIGTRASRSHTVQLPKIFTALPPPPTYIIYTSIQQLRLVNVLLHTVILIYIYYCTAKYKLQRIIKKLNLNNIIKIQLIIFFLSVFGSVASLTNCLFISHYMSINYHNLIDIYIGY